MLACCFSPATTASSTHEQCLLTRVDNKFKKRLLYSLLSNKKLFGGHCLVLACFLFAKEGACCLPISDSIDKMLVVSSEHA